jgi:hypothetical protein
MDLLDGSADVAMLEAGWIETMVHQGIPKEAFKVQWSLKMFNNDQKSSTPFLSFPCHPCLCRFLMHRTPLLLANHTHSYTVPKYAAT